MTTLFIPNSLPVGNGRVHYAATFEQPWDLRDRSLAPDSNGFFTIFPTQQVLFRLIGRPYAEFHVKDTGISAHIKLEMLEGKKKHTKGDLEQGDTFIEQLGVLRFQPGNKEIEG